jgi:hypothetical protein
VKKGFGKERNVTARFEFVSRYKINFLEKSLRHESRDIVRRNCTGEELN